MNTSKMLLASLRNGDFAHPGEIDAIDLTMAAIPKIKDQWLLDVGCGLGGTAYYLQQHGFGQVMGIDLDGDVLAHAKQHYPNHLFHQADATHAQDLIFEKKFSVIYFFSSFFCISPQTTCLSNMHAIAADQATLVIFDYSRPQEQTIPNPFPWSKTVKHCHPIHLPSFEKTLATTGWQLKASLDLTAQFKHWYQQLLQRFIDKQDTLGEKFGPLYKTMYNGYAELLQLMEAQKIGGIALYATKA